MFGWKLLENWSDHLQKATSHIIQFQELNWVWAPQNKSLKSKKGPSLVKVKETQTSKETWSCLRPQAPEQEVLMPATSKEKRDSWKMFWGGVEGSKSSRNACLREAATRPRAFGCPREYQAGSQVTDAGESRQRLQVCCSGMEGLSPLLRKSPFLLWKLLLWKLDQRAAQVNLISCRRRGLLL